MKLVLISNTGIEIEVISDIEDRDLESLPSVGLIMSMLGDALGDAYDADHIATKEKFNE
jgi:hypothetical protein